MLEGVVGMKVANQESRESIVKRLGYIIEEKKNEIAGILLRTEADYEQEMQLYTASGRGNWALENAIQYDIEKVKEEIKEILAFKSDVNRDTNTYISIPKYIQLYLMSQE